MRIVLMGPPGAGKGTQAAYLSQRYQIPAISTGDIFRAMKSSKTRLALQLQAIMNTGGYVGDDITNAVVTGRLAEADCRDGFLLDGYPRTLDQAEALTSFLAERGHAIDLVISLDVDEDDLTTRLLNRAQSEGRADDNAETIRKRQRVYAEKTAPVLNLYRSRGVLLEVDGRGGVEETSKRLSLIVDSHPTTAPDSAR